MDQPKNAEEKSLESVIRRECEQTWTRVRVRTVVNY